jgi:alpha-glucosidase (family GH31 glycosyl hydrolase)
MMCGTARSLYDAATFFCRQQVCIRKRLQLVEGHGRVRVDEWPGVEDEREPYRLYNLDVFEYLAESNFGLYGAVPVMLSHKAGLTVGAFW